MLVNVMTPMEQWNDNDDAYVVGSRMRREEQLMLSDEVSVGYLHCLWKPCDATVKIKADVVVADRVLSSLKRSQFDCRGGVVCTMT
jgi:hypothetical protein